jgi:hypothetical protein
MLIGWNRCCLRRRTSTPLAPADTPASSKSRPVASRQNQTTTRRDAPAAG